MYTHANVPKSMKEMQKHALDMPDIPFLKKGAWSYFNLIHAAQVKQLLCWTAAICNE